jgi:Leucine-rich repeat (LRR) protein
MNGLSRLEELPAELLWTILGFLDALTLRTARLVSNNFRHCASSHLKKLQLDSATLEQHPTANLTQFSGLTHLAISIANVASLQLLTRPNIAPVVTHVHLNFLCCEDTQRAGRLAELRELPKLRGLSLQPLEGDQWCIPSLPAGLEELQLHDLWTGPRWPGMEDVSPLTRFSKLTSLTVSMAHRAGPSLSTLTSLRKLQSLTLVSCPPVVGVLSLLTSLTSLSLYVPGETYQGSIFHDLAHLTGLSELSVNTREVTRGDLACVGQLINLTSLDMYGCTLAEGVTGSRALVALTRLASLALHCEDVGMSLLPSLNLKALRHLNLRDIHGDVSILQTATMLTGLELLCTPWLVDGCIQGLTATLSGMTGLQSLSLYTNDVPHPRGFPSRSCPGSTNEADGLGVSGDVHSG